MPSHLDIFAHNMATMKDLLKGQYNEEQWYERYREYLWTEEDDRFIKVLLALAYHGKGRPGMALRFRSIDQILKAIVREQGMPPCIKYAKKGGFSGSEIFEPQKIYRASQQSGDSNHDLYLDVTEREKKFWKSETKKLQKKYQVVEGELFPRICKFMS